MQKFPERLIRLLAVAALIVFLAGTFRAGWNRGGSDFPNYYTAAVLVKKGAQLRNYYNWPWFQKEMNYAGVENQLGGYIPQTPLTMLPMLGIAGFQPQTAKRIWLSMNLLFLGGSLWLLSRLTRFSIAQLWLLTFIGYGTIHTNFRIGQYYVFLLLLLVLAFWCLQQKRDRTGGLFLAAAFAMKLYGAPFALYFAARRRWRVLAGMIAGSVIFAVIAILMFGWRDNVYFVTQILPRALQGETLDPFNSGNGTVSTLLRRTFVLEPELNPHPLWNVPWMFFFLQVFLTTLILIFPVLIMGRTGNEKRAFAWFFVALILASPNTASYTFILLLLPVALLLEEANAIERVILIACYCLISLPLWSAWSGWFPRVVLLATLFCLAGRPYVPLLRSWKSAGAVALAALVAFPLGFERFKDYGQQPGQKWERIDVRKGAIYSSSPAVLRSGIVYESIGKSHYVLRWFHDGRDQEFTFAGDAFHPVACTPDGPIQFELVAKGRSTTMLLDVISNKKMLAAAQACAATRVPIISPDGKWAISTESLGGSEQIWLRNTAGRSRLQLTGGSCNSFSPAWELDSKAVIFASDCGRGIGLPALYRARLDKIGGPG
jgi:hypothetical protein